jgi:hypothetical protein
MMHSETIHSPALRRINVGDVITLTARLAQVMAEEVDLLKGMKVKAIDALQEEKLFLIQALETHKKILKRSPEISEQIPSRDRQDLADVVKVFEDVLEENHRKLQMAKEVNQQIVRAIREVVCEQSATRYYNNSGMRPMSPHSTMSVTLNQTI